MCELLNRARRARLIPMAAIRDDGGARLDPSGWQDAADFLSAIRDMAGSITPDRSMGQPRRLILMCEAAGMAPQLAQFAHPLGVPVLSSGGFGSTTERYRLAAEIAEDGRPTEVLHIGDHDPSGTHIFLALAEEVSAFTAAFGSEARFTRLAVMPTQIATLALLIAPPKPSDRRAFGRDVPGRGDPAGQAGRYRARRGRGPARYRRAGLGGSARGRGAADVAGHAASCNVMPAPITAELLDSNGIRCGDITLRHRAPIFALARRLLAEGADPTALLTVRWASTGTVSMIEPPGKLARPDLI